MRGLANLLRAGRLDAGLTQRAVSDALDVTERTVVRWESGDSLPAYPEVLRVADLYGLNVLEATLAWWEVASGTGGDHLREVISGGLDGPSGPSPTTPPSPPAPPSQAGEPAPKATGRKQSRPGGRKRS